MKILYVMSIPWGWIKQRPHFIAEELSKHVKVDVYSKKSMNVSSNHLLTDKPSTSTNLTINTYRIYPFYSFKLTRYLPLDWINRLLLRMQVKDIKGYDYIWITSPRIYSLFSSLIDVNQKLIYDCMDDAAEFEHAVKDKWIKNYILNNEKRLLARANYVFASADYLKNKILERSGLINKNVLVVNNAIQLPDARECEITDVEILKKLNLIKSISKPIIYVGTIAEWFDFKTVISVLENDSSLNLVLIGPNNVCIPQHKQITYLGTIKREFIFSFFTYAYALVMPFKVTELIKSVNPVKLYEYIYSGKPVIASRYGETIKFSEFVFLYKDADEFSNYLRNIDPKYYNNDYKRKCIEFVSHNKWSDRCEVILSHIKGK